MVTHQAKPMNERGVQPPKGRLTWMAIIGVALFIVLLLAVVMRPAADQDTAAETAPASAVTSSAPTDPTGTTTAPTESAAR
jgi:hypothetical protein